LIEVKHALSRAMAERAEFGSIDKLVSYATNYETLSDT
jgi:hypothetical protein